MIDPKPILERVLNPPNHARPPKPKTAFYPNDIGACPRKTFFEFTNTVPDSDWVKTEFPYGRAIGSYVADRFRRAGFSIETEVGVGHENPAIRGYIDILIWLDGKWYPIEVKSVKNAYAMKEVREDHLDQIQSYIQMGHFEGGFLLYIQRDSGEMSMQWIEVDNLRWRTILNRCDDITRRVVNGKVPDRPEGFSPSEYPCKWCPFSKRCWS